MSSLSRAPWSGLGAWAGPEMSWSHGKVCFRILHIVLYINGTSEIDKT